VPSLRRVLVGDKFLDLSMDRGKELDG